MTITQFENRAYRLFGREADLAALLRRTQRSGLTAIVGPPQIGKSWLLMELARRLDRETNPRCLVGFTRSPKGANDPLLQVVSDLYQRWLADARAREQLRAVWEQQKMGCCRPLHGLSGSSRRRRQNSSQSVSWAERPLKTH